MRPPRTTAPFQHMSPGSPEALRDGLDTGGLVVRVWSQGVFEASKTNIEALERMVQDFDFAVLVFSADDIVFSRGKEFAAPRDRAGAGL